ncbi:MAG: ATP-binding protein, partial [Polyangia bacterium]|nr:ATP-binding protein [Polyangia bacterium]
DGFVKALSNLIQNGLTHGGDSGPVVVTARADRDGVAVSVRDSGRGLSAKEQMRVFKRFYRGKSTTEGQVPGFGLGLSIVQRFAEDQGGKVSVVSGPGQGAIFTIWLPASAKDIPDPRQDTAATGSQV